MKPGRLFLWLYLLALAGCTEPGSYKLFLVFPDTQAEQDTAVIDLWALHRADADCAQIVNGDLIIRDLPFHAYAELVYPPGDPPHLPGVPAGSVLFAAEGRTEASQVILRGCRGAEVEGGKVVEVTIALERICTPDPDGEEPANGVDDDCDGLTDECDADVDCDDGNQCTTDLCISLECTHIDVQDGTPCDDADSCTRDDGCLAGVCTGTPMNCEILFEALPLPEGGDISRLAYSASDTTTLYARAGGRLFRSDDLSDPWIECTLPGAATGGLSVAPENPATLCLGVGEDVLLSTTACESWSSTGFDQIPRRLLFLPGGEIVAGTDDGLWRYTGGSWERSQSSQDGFRITALAADASGQILYAASNGNGVVRSEDGGSSWQPASTGLTSLNITGLSLDWQDPQHVIAIGTNVFFTTDGGSNWQVSGSYRGSNPYSVAVDPYNPDFVVLSIANGVFSSTNGGSSFGSTDRRNSNWSKARSFYLLFDTGTPGRLYAASCRGVMVVQVPDPPSSAWPWTASVTGMNAWPVRSIARSQSTDRVHLATTAGVMTSLNDGQSWSLVGRDFPVYSYVNSVVLDEQDENRLYAGGKATLLLSVDQGANFSEVYSPTGTWGIESALASGQRLCVGTDRFFAISNDWGVGWTETLVADEERNIEDILTVANRILVATNTGIFQSEDEGLSFASLSHNLTGQDTRTLAHLADGTLLAGTLSLGVYALAPGADNWEPAGLDSTAVRDLLTCGGVLYAATDDGLYQSLDAAATWTELAGLSGKALLSLATDSQGRLWVGTKEHGLYRSDAACP